ncbi:site-specific DNA-methyltransferase [Phaeodactylibacter xiamenensis]|uniref:site-specific DNA-methyltransferase n=1 Tax=Phaeodactylibacter xiamenensis TaxID=1524460 RepID=UPI003CCBEE21
MPTLNWIGKEKVVNHHRDVPYRVLEHKYGFTAENGEQPEPTGSGNKIIHGDNLEALKSLLPEYEGKIKCIYIDPPYNTGNENWVYNDNVNHPKIKKWLGEVVGKEGDDLSRHDKWLCMMYPRIRLLHQLLSPDGLLFVNLDDTEAFNFKLMADEIFGLSNFISNISWEKRFTRSNNAKLFSSIKDNLFVYRKSNNVDSLREKRNAKADSTYTNPDNDPRGVWTSVSYVNPATKEKRPNLTYPLFNPITKKEVHHPTHAWKYSKKTYKRHIENNLLYWGKEGKNTFPRLKKFLSEMDGMVPVDIWKHEDSGTTDEASKLLEHIFGEKSIFDTPKPPKLIERVIQLSTVDNSIILDSFAGSGTTAHAVLSLNKEDGGNRKFILIEMEDYADKITAERVKRVAKGYGSDSKKVEGTGGEFDYYELGPALFDENENLNEEVGLQKIREYIWFSETRTPFTDSDSEQYLLGKKDDSVYYFIYEKDRLTTLDYDALELIKTKGEQYIIYADNCLLPADFMAKHNIIFKKIPRDITRF